MAASTVRPAKARKNVTHKKLRRNDKLAILEGLAPEIVIPAPKVYGPKPFVPSGPLAYRLVIQTQVYENYGAHNWDGTGECPQYWKAKGGNEYQTPATYAIGETTSDNEQKVLDRYRHMIEQRSEGYHEYIIGVDWVSTHEETPDEYMRRDMADSGYRDYGPSWRMLTPEAEMDQVWGMYHACYSVEGHNRRLTYTHRKPEDEAEAA